MSEPQGDFAGAVAELRTELTSLAKTFAGKQELGEFKECMDKVQKDVTNLLDWQKEDAERITKTNLEDFEPNADVAKKLAKLHVTWGEESRKDDRGFASHMSRGAFRKNFRGQTKAGLAADDDVRDALHLADIVFIADKIKSAVDPKWEALKINAGDGGRELFAKHFPDLFERFDPISEALGKLTGKATLVTGSTPGTGTTGGSWVPDAWTSELLDEIRVATPEINVFPTFNQPTKWYNYPLLTGIGTAYERAEATAVAASELTTSKIQWEAKEVANLQKFSHIIEEDSIVAIGPEVRANIVRSLAEGLSRAIQNGDEDNTTHIDDDLQSSAGDPSTNFLWYGLRRFALDAASAGTRVDVDGGGNIITSLDVANALAKLGKWGAQRIAAGEIVLFVTPSSWSYLLQDTNVITLDKYGPQATILTGELGRVWGIPIFVSFGLAEREGLLASTGMNDATGNTLSCAVLCNRMAYKIGDRRQAIFEQDKNIESGVISMVGALRASFKSAWDASGRNPLTDNPHTCVIRNIT